MPALNRNNLERQLDAWTMSTMQFPTIRHSQTAFLWAVAVLDGGSVTELASRLGTTLGGVSRNIDIFGSGNRKNSTRHKQWGLVEVKSDPNDDRLQLVYLTDKGRNFIDLFSKTFIGE